MPTTEDRSTAPDAGEYAEYFGRYIGLVPAGDVVETIDGQFAETLALLSGIDEARTTEGYAPGKWSIRDVVLHIADAERIFMYRALRIGRGDSTPLASFDENAYTPLAGANARSMDGLLTELLAVRESTLELLSGLPVEAWDRRGIASEKPVSVRALAWITAGHEVHHRRIVRERYL